MTSETRPHRHESDTDGSGFGLGDARRAVLWMIGAVVFSVPLPLIVWAGVRDMSPYLFVALMYVVATVGQACWRQLGESGGRKDRRRRLVVFDDLAATKSIYFWLSAVSRVDWLLFALSVTLVEPVVATVVFEFWPVFFGLLTLSGFWKSKMLEGAPQQGTARMLTMLVVGGIGVSLAVLSDTGTTGWSSTATLGVLLAVLAAFVTASVAMSLQMMGGDQRGDFIVDRTAVSVSGDAAARAVAAPVIALVGTVEAIVGSSGWWSTSGLLFAVAAGAIHVAASWCFQRANHIARDAHGQTAAQINALYYPAPVGALVLLAWLADTTIERPDLLIAGAAGVVVVNMVLHLDPEGAHQRDGAGGQGYQALVLALWAVGAVVLFRDDWLPDGWQVWSVVEYWGIVGVCATVFTLILSFRQSRLAERRRDMDALMLRLHQQIVFMGSSGDLSRPSADEASRLLREVDTAREPEDLRDAYFELRKLLIGKMHPKSDRERAKRLSDLLAEVEVLVNLRQQGRNFTELAVLGLFAFLTVALTVAARPDGSIEPFAGWVHDTTSMVLGAAFAFLGFDLIDKRREADAPILRQVTSLAHTVYGQPQGWRLELVSYRDQVTDRVVASLLGAVLLVGAVVMLGIKWL